MITLQDEGFSNLADAQLHARRRATHLNRNQMIYVHGGRYFVDTVGRDPLGKVVKIVKP
jgi:hypothetical protein